MLEDDDAFGELYYRFLQIFQRQRHLWIAAGLSYTYTLFVSYMQSARALMHVHGSARRPVL